MAKRYGISPIIGNGTFQSPFRAAMSDAVGDGGGCTASIPTDSSGHPVWRFCLVVFSTGQLATVAAVSNSYVFPDYVLDGVMTSMDAGARSGMDSNVSAFDLDGSGTHVSMLADTDSAAYRAVIASIGSQLDAVFNLNNFDVQGA